MRNSIFSKVVLSLTALGVAGLVGGCSSNFQPDPHQTLQGDIGTIQGEVHGGQSPITGAEIFLFAASTHGYAGAATSLLTAHTGTTQATGTTATDGGVFTNDYYVKTGAGGSFSISGDYQCTAGTQVYLVAYGGNPGLSTANTFNTGIMQMAGLGECPATGNLAATVPNVVINEISTVVFAYAMGGFGTSATHIGSSGSALAQTGIANAMANVSNVLNIGYGQVPITANGNPNSVVPQSKIYTLANILATCVNSASRTTSGCTNVFNKAPSSSGNVPTDEATAMFNIVHNPTANVTALFNLQPANAVFAPNLMTHPTDWTLPIVYKSVVSRPSNIAFDSLGDAWISDRTKDAVIKVGPQGAVTTITQAGVGSIYNVAVDQGDVVWAADFSNSHVYRLDTSGNLLSNITTGSLNEPTAISFDANGTAFVVNSNIDRISRYTAAGTALTAATYPAALGTPFAISMDNSGNAWVPTFGANCGCVAELTDGSTTATNTANGNGGGGGLFGGGADAGQLNDSTAIAVDSGNNTWQANVNNKLIQFAVVCNSFLFGCGNGILQGKYNVGDYVTTTNGGLNAPATLAIDGGNNLWVANSGTNTVSGFSVATATGGFGVTTTTTTPLYSTTSGFPSGSATTAKTYAAAPDGSGNLWTANSDGTVTQLLGIATPTATPVVPGQLGTTP